MTTIPIRLYASEANEWSVCPLYATINRGYTIPEDENDVNESRDDGIVAHAIIEQLANSSLDFPTIGVMFLNREYTYEMDYFVRKCIDFIRNTPGAKIESKFKLPSLNENIKGRSDLIGYDPGKHTVISVDFKFGRTYVNEYRNRQLLLAALAFIEEHGIDTLGLKIELTVIQTRCYGTEHVRTDTLSYEDALKEREIVRQSAIEAQKGLQAKAVPGDTCRKCNGRHACKYNQEAVWSQIENLPKRADVVLMGNEASKELFFLEKQLELLEGRVTALRSQVEFDAKNGKFMDYHKMERGRLGDLVWLENVTADDIEAIGALSGKDLIIKKPITPTQAGALVGKELIAPFAKRLPAKEKLVPIENKDRLKDLEHLKIEL